MPASLASRRKRSKRQAAVRGFASMGRPRNVATLRTLEVLSAFAFGEQTYGVTELSRALGMTKNMVYRALTTLADQGYVTRLTSDSRYALSYGVLGLLNPHFPVPDFRSIAAPYLQELHALNDFTVQLSIRAGDYQQAAEVFERLQTQCARFLDWFERDQVHNNLAMALHRLNLDSECLRELSKTEAASAGNELKLREHFVGAPFDFERYLPVARTTWKVQRACGGSNS